MMHGKALALSLVVLLTLGAPWIARAAEPVVLLDFENAAPTPTTSRPAATTGTTAPTAACPTR